MRFSRLAAGALICLILAAAVYQNNPGAPDLLRDAPKDLRLEDISISDVLKLEPVPNAAGVSGETVSEHPFHCIGKLTDDPFTHPFVLIGDLKNQKNHSLLRLWQKQKDLSTVVSEFRGLLRVQKSNDDSDQAGTLYNTNQLDRIKSVKVFLDPSWRQKNTGVFPVLLDFFLPSSRLKFIANTACYNGSPNDHFPGLSKEMTELRLKEEADNFNMHKYWRKVTLLTKSPALDRVFQETDILTSQELFQPRQKPLFRGTDSSPDVKFREGFKGKFRENFQPDENHARSLADILDTPSTAEGNSGRAGWISFSTSRQIADQFGRFVYEVYKPGGVDLTEIHQRYIPKIIRNLSRGPGNKEVVFSRDVEPRYIRGAFDRDRQQEFIPNPNFAP